MFALWLELFLANDPSDWTVIDRNGRYY
jgi:hypothetical protein